MAPGQLRLRDNDGVNEGRCQSLQFLATAGDRGCRLIQQTGNLAVCEFEGLFLRYALISKSRSGVRCSGRSTRAGKVH